jgi:hypothetical protein
MRSSTHARHVGRIGGLAVALGIGIAVGTTAGTAVADDADTASRSESRTERKKDDTEPDRKSVSERASEKRENKKKPTRRDRLSAVRLSPAEEAGNDTADDPARPPRTAGLTALLGSARRDTAEVEVPDAASPLATPEQLAAELRAEQIAQTPIVGLAKTVLKVAWLFSAQRNYALAGGPDDENLARLDQAVDEYAMQAAMEVQMLNPTKPVLLQQVMPPHTWGGGEVEGTRIWCDNPDTIYRFVATNAASEYLITGQFPPGQRPADTNFSVLTGLNGQTATNLNGSDLEVDADGRFAITVSAAPPSDPGADHLQLSPEATLITTRNTLSDWNTQAPMSVSIQRVAGPPNSLFAQLGGFLIPGLGPAVTRNPALVSLVSLIPPLPEPPLAVQATEAALLMLLLGITKQDEYIRVATTDPVTGQLRQPNTLSTPAHNAQFLSTQLQSAGYFQLEDGEALVLTVQPGSASYFVVPVTDDWTITGDYWNQQTSLNNAQAVPNTDGSYTVVVAKDDPGVANWVSTGGLDQGTMSIRFQGVDPNSPDLPAISAIRIPLDQAPSYVQPDQLVYSRPEQLASRQAGYASRYGVPQ